MKKAILFLTLILFAASLPAAELVLIKTKNFQEVKSLSVNGRLTLNYLGNGFVIATKHQSIDQDVVVLEENAWQKGYAYFIVYADKDRNQSYRTELGAKSVILYQDQDILLVKSPEQAISGIPIPADGSMARIWNQAASLPKNGNLPSMGTRSPDPFIVARMAEVNTTLIQSNIQHLQDYGTRNAYSSQGILAQNWIKQQFESFGLSTSLFDFTMPSGADRKSVV